MTTFSFLNDILIHGKKYENILISENYCKIAKKGKPNPTQLKIFIIEFYSCRDLAVFSKSDTSVFVRFGSPEEVPAVQATTPG